MRRNTWNARVKGKHILCIFTKTQEVSAKLPSWTKTYRKKIITIVVKNIDDVSTNRNIGHCTFVAYVFKLIILAKYTTRLPRCKIVSRTTFVVRVYVIYVIRIYWDLRLKHQQQQLTLRSTARTWGSPTTTDPLRGRDLCWEWSPGQRIPGFRRRSTSCGHVRSSWQTRSPPVRVSAVGWVMT